MTIDFAEVKHLGFEFIANGLWANNAKGLCIMINEDYGNTFRAYSAARPFSHYILKNKNGNAIRFRSPQSAARFALKHEAATAKINNLPKIV